MTGGRWQWDKRYWLRYMVNIVQCSDHIHHTHTHCTGNRLTNECWFNVLIVFEKSIKGIGVAISFCHCELEWFRVLLVFCMARQIHSKKPLRNDYYQWWRTIIIVTRKKCNDKLLCAFQRIADPEFFVKYCQKLATIGQESQKTTNGWTKTRSIYLH